MKPLRLPALAAALILAACSSPAPTDPSLRGPTGPSFDGGNMIGSGNAQETGTGGTGESTVSTDSTGRGGGFLGSGN